MTFGGATVDYSKVWDPRTQRSSKYFCRALSSAGGMTRMSVRSLCALQAASAFLLSSNNVWDNGAGAKPTVTNGTTGIYVITYPSLVPDDITPGFPGHNTTGHYVNLRAGWVSVASASGADDYVGSVSASATSATVYIRNASSRALTNLGASDNAYVFVI